MGVYVLVVCDHKTFLTTFDYHTDISLRYYISLSLHTTQYTPGASMSAGGGDGETAEGEGYGADQQSEDDQINEMMAGSDAELQVSALYKWDVYLSVHSVIVFVSKLENVQTFSTKCVQLKCETACAHFV